MAHPSPVIVLIDQTTTPLRLQRLQKIGQNQCFAKYSWLKPQHLTEVEPIYNGDRISKHYFCCCVCINDENRGLSGLSLYLEIKKLPLQC